MLNCIDNSGAAIVECVAVMRKKVKHARIGQQVQSSPCRMRDSATIQATVSLSLCRSKGHSAPSPGQARLDWASPTKCEEEIRHAVVVRANTGKGSLIRFDDNACVLINKTGDPIGTRLTSKVTFP
jgi:large subunit ribosomal protein L14